MPLAAYIADAVMDDLVGDEFSQGSKWELEGADDDCICIKEGLCNIGVIQLRDPKVRPEEFVEGEYGAIEKNQTNT